MMYGEFGNKRDLIITQYSVPLLRILSSSIMFVIFTFKKHFTLKMTTVSTSETSVNFYETTRRNITEDSYFHIRAVRT
jgi:hypothetical protein